MGDDHPDVEQLRISKYALRELGEHDNLPLEGLKGILRSCFEVIMT